MKVLVVSTNRCSLPIPVLPLGAAMAAEAARRAGHQVAFLDLMFARDPLAALGRAIRSAAPDVVGLSVRNIDNADLLAPVAYTDALPPMMAAIRARTAAPVVLGGSAVGVMPEHLLRCTGAEWAVLGDGEAVFPRLLAALAGQGSPREVPGVAWLERGRLRLAAIARHALDGAKVSELLGWLAPRAYARRFAAVPLQTKRGCPFACVYCTYPMLEGRDYRLVEPDRVVAAVRETCARGLRDIEFVDNVFNAPYGHALAICEGIARARPGARLQTMDLSPEFVDDALLDAMERAGFVGIGITAEAAADAPLRGLGKSYGAAEAWRAAEAVRRHAIPCLWIFLLGGPGETEATVRETLRFADEVVRPRDGAFFSIGVRIYPGTPLEGLARHEGLLGVPPEEMLQPVFYLSPGVERERLVRAVREASARRLEFFDSDSVTLPLLSTLRRLAYWLGWRPPLWQHARGIRRLARLLRRDPR